MCLSRADDGIYLLLLEETCRNILQYVHIVYEYVHLVNIRILDFEYVKVMSKSTLSSGK